MREGHELPQSTMQTGPPLTKDPKDQTPESPATPWNEDEILKRLARIGEGGRRPLGDFLRMSESVGDEDLKTVKNFLFNLYCQIYGITQDKVDSDHGRLLRFKFFQELSKGSTVEVIKDIFIRNLFLTENQALVAPIVRQARVQGIAARAKDLIDSRYNERLSLNSVAETLSVSKEHLSRAFKRQFSVTVTEYIQGVRVRVAKSLIQENDLSLKEICYELGYQSYNDFYRNFRKLEGISPKEFQEDLAGKAGSPRPDESRPGGDGQEA